MTKTLLIGLAAISLLTSTTGAQNNDSRSAEQTRFGLEQLVDHPVIIPKNVLDRLRQDADLRTCKLSSNLRDTIPADWFEASAIHLDGKNEVDLIVKAQNACMWGPNLGPFWIFRRTPKGYKLVLSTMAVGLQVLESRTNRLKDLKAGAIIALGPQYVTYKFDGREYQPED